MIRSIPAVSGGNCSFAFLYNRPAQGLFDLGAGAVARMKDPAPLMGAFEVRANPPPASVSARSNWAPRSISSLTRFTPSLTRILTDSFSQRPAPGGERIFEVELGGVVHFIDGGGDAPLRFFRGRFADLSFQQDGNLAEFGGGEGGAQSGNSPSDH